MQRTHIALPQNKINNSDGIRFIPEQSSYKYKYLHQGTIKSDLPFRMNSCHFSKLIQCEFDGKHSPINTNIYIEHQLNLTII